MKRFIFTLAIYLGFQAACEETLEPEPTKNLDHPVDMSILCLGVVGSGAGGAPVLTGQPMSFCHPEAAKDPEIATSDGRRIVGTFGFILDTGRGEVAVADLDHHRLLDLSRSAAGFGLLPITGQPRALATSEESCHVAVATQSACSVTLLDPSRILAETFTKSGQVPSISVGSGPAVHTLSIVTESGKPLSVTLGELAFLPAPKPQPVCTPGDRPRIVATVPGCDLVAIMELSSEEGTARILSSAYVKPTLPGGFAQAGGEPVCREECTPNMLLRTDGGATDLDGGVSPENNYRVQPLALTPDGRRVFIGSLYNEGVFLFPIDGQQLGDGERLLLAEGAQGTTHLRLAMDPYRTSRGIAFDGTERVFQGTLLANRGAFLYALARDNSVRVLSLDEWIECDVNTILSSDKERACIPIGGAPRRLLADGPGIRIPSFTNASHPPPLPRDIAFVDLQPPNDESNLQALRGQYGFLLASNNQVYVLNLAPNNEGTTQTHSFRDYRELGKLERTHLGLNLDPQRIFASSDQPYAFVNSFSSLNGPQIATFTGGDTSYIQFPDPDAIVSRSWSIAWEGGLPRGARMSGIVSHAEHPSLAGRLSDMGGDYCSVGVEPGDIVLFPGCNKDSDCQPDDEFYCEMSVSGTRGMCLPKTQKTDENIRRTCSRFMSSRMRYEVRTVTPSYLDLGLKLDEVPKTLLNPCSPVNETDSKATQEAKIAECQPTQVHQPFPGIIVDKEADKGFQCYAVEPNNNKCVKRCGTKTDINDWVINDRACRPGTVCEFVPNVDPALGPLCVEGPPIDKTCWPQPVTSYRVHAGKAFLIAGSSMPEFRTHEVSTTGTCQPRSNRDAALVNRIPLSAPRCPAEFLDSAIGAGIAIQTLPPQTGANPCFFREAEDEASCQGKVEPDGTPVYCTPPFRAYVQNPQVRFVLKNLNDYMGDLLSIYFEIEDGFIPLTVQIPSYEVLLTMGTRIITGPTKTPESPILQDPATGSSYYPYLYVVDQGRTALTPGSRGQILRINPRKESTAVAAFDFAVSGTRAFQLQ
jgi:hypothetical protein